MQLQKLLAMRKIGETVFPFAFPLPQSRSSGAGDKSVLRFCEARNADTSGLIGRDHEV